MKPWISEYPIPSSMRTFDGGLVSGGSGTVSVSLRKISRPPAESITSLVGMESPASSLAPASVK